MFLVGLALLVCAYAVGWSWAWWLLLPGAAFVGLMAFHERTLRAKRRCTLLVRFYEQGLARLKGKWAGKGEQGGGLAPVDHPFAHDIDLFGEGSLFELVCAASTKAGKQRLADWFCEPASAAVMRARQEAVRELTHDLELREELAVCGAEVEAKVTPVMLTDWASRPSTLPVTRLRAIVLALALAAVAAWVLSCLTGGVLFSWAVFLAAAAVFLWVRRPLRDITRSAEGPLRELVSTRPVFACLERERFQCALLAELHGTLSAGKVPASRHIARLERLQYTAETLQRNMGLGLVAALVYVLGSYGALAAFLTFVVLGQVLLTLSLEAWRAQWGGRVPQWLSAVGTLEAVSSLACYAYEHPDDAFPEVVDDGACFRAIGLGHPLIGDDKCVRNDVVLGEAPRLQIVSGSNMSGKSTLLASVGQNVVLARAGAPVRARQLVLSPLALGATIFVHGSIQRGASQFYAELLRLRDMMKVALGEYPLLFLLDEILHGTNSHDRRIGASALMRMFMGLGAIGFITTHDLALTAIAEQLGVEAVNVHFASRFEGGELRFDYKLKPGVVQESNALLLMESLGLLRENA